MHEAAEGRDADAGPDQHHGAVGDEFFRERVGHEAAEHRDADVEGLGGGGGGGDEALREAFEEAGADAEARVAGVVGELVDADGDLDDAAAVGGLEGAGSGNGGLGAGDLRVLGEGVEAWHECAEDAEEVVEWWAGGGESGEELDECDVGPGAEVADRGLALGGREIHEDLALVGVPGVCGKDAE